MNLLGCVKNEYSSEYVKSINFSEFGSFEQIILLYINSLH